MNRIHQLPGLQNLSGPERLEELRSQLQKSTKEIQDLRRKQSWIQETAADNSSGLRDPDFDDELHRYGDDVAWQLQQAIGFNRLVGEMLIKELKASS
jgi:hypothetical protein